MSFFLPIPSFGSMPSPPLGHICDMVPPARSFELLALPIPARSCLVGDYESSMLPTTSASLWRTVALRCADVLVPTFNMLQLSSSCRAHASNSTLLDAPSFFLSTVHLTDAAVTDMFY